MLVVDSSVWIDFFAGHPSPARQTLRRLLYEGELRIVVPDLVLFEVLRGFRHEREYRQARTLMETLSIEPVAGTEIAIEAAQHYRSLRAGGVTVRSALDVLIATFCIERGYALLHRDRDFDVFERLRGLRAWRH
ncbi:Ribonuclease VapC [Rubrivivax sp. A210]|uniref:type II toxin-antitoxin system VapC family toxin n=1 Tax=Rubrivivax sp. A210 TaxID=2772301 RepID=UPI00191A6017|nr:PIN domain nuclease [Rubrivivax sp. A210]CAD5374101.1 Ribonuclease VapC [Rubrivivax sp. A210]